MQLLRRFIQPAVLASGTAPARGGVLRIGSFAFAAGFVLIGVALAHIDLRNRYFDGNRVLYPVHHLLKAALAGYLAWLTYVPGVWVVRWVERTRGSLGLPALDLVVGRFFVGFAVVHLVMLLAGLLHLYYPVVVWAGGAVILLLSWPMAAGAAAAARHLPVPRAPAPTRWAVYGLAAATAVLAGKLFLLKVLYPTGDWDNIAHYNPYYAEVLRNHHLAPNTVWYHYYYSKGAGGFFLAALASDDHGHKVYTFVVLGGMCLALGSMLWRVTRSAALSWAGVLGYLGASATSEWYIFDKQHVVTCCLLVAGVWAATVYPRVAAGARGAWAGLAAGVAAATVWFCPTAFGLLFPCYAAAAAGCLLAGARAPARHAAVAAGAGVAAMAFVLALNYAATGMAEINPLKPFWMLADKGRMAEWCSPMLPMVLLDGWPTSHNTFSLRTSKLADWGAAIFHLRDLSRLSPGVLVLVPAAWLFLGTTRRLPRVWTAARVGVLAPAGALLVVGAGMSLIADQPVSIVRYYIFTCPLLIVGAGLVAALLRAAVVAPGRRPVFDAAVAAFVVWQVFTTRPADPPPATAFRENILPFATGRSSYLQAYYQMGSFSPYMYFAKHTAGWDARILSFNPMHPVGSLPGRPLEVELNHGYRESHVMAFEDADVAEAALRREGLNFFLVDLDCPVNGMIPLGPVFGQANIFDRLKIVYHQGSVFLLTWRAPGEQVTASEKVLFTLFLQHREKTGNRGQYDRLLAAYRGRGPGAGW